MCAGKVITSMFLKISAHNNLVVAEKFIVFADELVIEWRKVLHWSELKIPSCEMPRGRQMPGTDNEKKYPLMPARGWGGGGGGTAGID